MHPSCLQDSPQRWPDILHSLTISIAQNNLAVPLAVLKRHGWVTAKAAPYEVDPHCRVCPDAWRGCWNEHCCLSWGSWGSRPGGHLPNSSSFLPVSLSSSMVKCSDPQLSVLDESHPRFFFFFKHRLIILMNHRCLCVLLNVKQVMVTPGGWALLSMPSGLLSASYPCRINLISETKEPPVWFTHMNAFGREIFLYTESKRFSYYHSFLCSFYFRQFSSTLKSILHNK